jgi:protein TonB
VGEQFAIPAKAGAVSVWLSRAAAFTAHAAVIGALIYTPATLEYGGSDVHSSAISVNVTTTQVLDSIDEKSDDSAAMQAPLAQDAPEPEPEPEKTPEPPKPEENIVLASPDAEAAPLAPEPVKPPEERKEKVEKDKKARRKKPKPEPRNVAASSGNSAKAGARGRVSASYGSVRNHDASVRARIARHIPRGLAGRGVTVIRFTISRTGALISCHIIDSSGHSALDRAALRAVRKSSPFGPPPGGQARTFTIPFIFH